MLIFVVTIVAGERSALLLATTVTSFGNYNSYSVINVYGGNVTWVECEVVWGNMTGVTGGANNEVLWRGARGGKGESVMKRAVSSVIGSEVGSVVWGTRTSCESLWGGVTQQVVLHLAEEGWTTYENGTTCSHTTRVAPQVPTELEWHSSRPHHQASITRAHHAIRVTPHVPTLLLAPHVPTLLLAPHEPRVSGTISTHATIVVPRALQLAPIASILAVAPMVLPPPRHRQKETELTK